jgi:GTP cyclohydrolase I
VTVPDIASNIRSILDNLGIDPKHPDFKDTPERVERMYRDFFKNNYNEIRSLLDRQFPSPNSQMIVVPNIPAFGLCPHHLLPVSYRIFFGYIPKDFVIGVSKIPRVIKLIVRYPNLQENITQEIVDLFWAELRCHGAMVIMHGVHDCMRCRGIEIESPVITSAFQGSFAKQVVRNEFLRLIG